VFGYFLISFLAGVFVGSFVANPTRFMLVLMVVGAFNFVTFGRRDRMKGLAIGGCFLAAALGVFRYGSANFSHSVLSSFAGVEAGGKGVPVQLVGYIDEEPSLTSSGNASIVFRAKQLIVPGHILKTNERMLIIAKAFPEYKFGETLTVAGSLGLPDNFTPDFDYVAYLKNRSIRTTMLFPNISHSASPLSFGERLKLNVYSKLFAVKDKFESSIRNVMAEPNASYVNGILLGSRQDIPAELKEAFNRTGTTHILAISGYNITIIAQALLAALVFFVRRRTAFWLSVVFILLFTIMTGAGASVVRAAIMGLLLLAANGYGRMYDPKNSILLAAGAMVWLNPLSLRFDIGFQLSFMAVIGLMYVHPLLEHFFRRMRFSKEVYRNLKETLLMTVSAQLMVAPLLIYYFRQFSAVSLPANILVLPLMPLTMLFGFLSGAVGLILMPLGKALSLIAWLLTGYQLGIIKWLGGLSWASLKISMNWATLSVIYILFAVVVWNLRSKINRYEI